MDVLGELLSDSPLPSAVVDAILQEFDTMLGDAVSNDPADYQLAVRFISEDGVDIVGVDTPDTPRHLRQRPD